MPGSESCSVRSTARWKARLRARSHTWLPQWVTTTRARATIRCTARRSSAIPRSRSSPSSCRAATPRARRPMKYFVDGTPSASSWFACPRSRTVSWARPASCSAVRDISLHSIAPLLDELRAIRPIFCAAIERNQRAQLLDAVAQASSDPIVAFEANGHLAWMSHEGGRLARRSHAAGIAFGEAARRLATLDDADDPSAGHDAARRRVARPGAPPRHRCFARGPTRTVARSWSHSPVSRGDRIDWLCDVLPPRLSRVLELLKTGASEKEIANRTGLSYSSAHQYIVQIYRRAGVASRAQLMALFARNKT